VGIRPPGYGFDRFVAATLAFIARQTGQWQNGAVIVRLSMPGRLLYIISAEDFRRAFFVMPATTCMERRFVNAG
jgi:hypothetical protein